MSSTSKMSIIPLARQKEPMRELTLIMQTLPRQTMMITLFSTLMKDTLLSLKSAHSTIQLQQTLHILITPEVMVCSVPLISDLVTKRTVVSSLDLTCSLYRLEQVSQFSRANKVLTILSSHTLILKKLTNIHALWTPSNTTASKPGVNLEKITQKTLCTLVTTY